MGTELKKLNKFGIIKIIVAYIFIMVQASVFFLGAGRFDMPRGWLLFGLDIVYCSLSNLIMVLLNPEIINERGSVHAGTKKWDKIFFLLVSPLAIVIMPYISGIDTGRLSASHIPVIYSLLGCLLYIPAAIFIQWSIYVNRHFEVTVRIQSERGHRVISSGPYGIIRHPGYASTIILYLLTPIIVGSYYALIPAGLIAVLFVMRTALEDATLHGELEGYKEYAQKVRFRLIPGIW